MGWHVRCDQRLLSTAVNSDLRSFRWRLQMAARQRKEPVGAVGRTHGVRHEADVRFGHQRWPERQLYEVQLTSGRHWSASVLRRLLVCRAKWRYRPSRSLSGFHAYRDGVQAGTIETTLSQPLTP